MKDVRHDDCFSYLGEREDIDTLLRAVNVVVLPSYHEGLPLALVEAAACGLPLVATDIAGCQSVVREGVNGFLVPVRDSGELADAIARLIQDPALQAQFGSSSRRIALDEFSVEGITAKYAAFYQSLGLFEAGQDKT